MSKYNPAYSDSGENTKDPMKSDEKYYAQVVNANVRFLSGFFLCYNTLIISLWLEILQIIKYNDNSFSYQFYISFNCFFFHLWQKKNRKNKSMKT